MTVAELLRRIDSYEFSEWVVFDKIEREDEDKAQKEWEQQQKLSKGH